MGKLLTHTLNGVIIEEPIGFDQLKTTIKRGDYHGMSVEVSVGELEFYGEAARMITEAYNTDIDTELAYVVKTQDGMVLYQGVVDLTTYNEKKSEYRSVAVSVGEVGIKTTFNNRSDVEIDLNSDKTFDGDKLAHAKYFNHLVIPQKTIVYKNENRQLETTSYSSEPTTGNILQLPDDFSYAWLNLALDTIVKNEVGTMEPLFHLHTIPERNNVGGYAEPMYRSSESEIEEDTIVKINISLNMSITMSGSPFTNLLQDNPAITINPKVIKNNNKLATTGGSYVFIRKDDWSGERSLTLITSFSINKNELDNLYVGIELFNSNGKNNNYYNNPTQFSVKINSGSYVSMIFYSKQKNTISAEMILVHDALNRIVECISNNQLTVKSSLYQNPTSSVNAGALGEGALKAITNGYKIRNLYTNDNAVRNMPLSFKDAIENLDAIDCIGWGFSKEDNKLYIRVEKWDWFYQTHKLLNIDNADNITRKFDDTYAITELVIGYKKYTTAEDISSIDNVHGERVFTTTTKALTKQKSAMCNFIADNYAIEETRRAAINLDVDEEFKYDENIFIFALKAESVLNYNMLVSVPYDINHDHSGTFVIPEDIYNGTISPTRNAFRWLQRLFCIQGLKAFKLTKGTVNYQANYSLKQTGEGKYYLQDSMGFLPLLGVTTPDDSYQEYQTKENASLQEIYYANVREDDEGVRTPIPSSDDIAISKVFKAEEVSLKYPISIEQYQAIKDNPYGLVVVDGEECWIKEFQYDFNSSEAEFKLIPKA